MTKTESAAEMCYREAGGFMSMSSAPVASARNGTRSSATSVNSSASGDVGQMQEVGLTGNAPVVGLAPCCEVMVATQSKAREIDGNIRLRTRLGICAV